MAWKIEDNKLLKHGRKGQVIQFYNLSTMFGDRNELQDSFALSQRNSSSESQMKYCLYDRIEDSGLWKEWQRSKQLRCLLKQWFSIQLGYQF